MRYIVISILETISRCQDFALTLRIRQLHFLHFPQLTHHGCRNVSLLLFYLESHLILQSFNSTYYGKDYRAGAALLRARRPYLFKNAITGTVLIAFSLGVCTCFLPIYECFSLYGDLEDHKLCPMRQATPHVRTNLTRIYLLTYYSPSVAYTIKAVGQEEFSEVKVPEAPAKK